MSYDASSVAAASGASSSSTSSGSGSSSTATPSLGQRVLGAASYGLCATIGVGCPDTSTAFGSAATAGASSPQSAGPCAGLSFVDRMWCQIREAETQAIWIVVAIVVGLILLAIVGLYLWRKFGPHYSLAVTS